MPALTAFYCRAHNPGSLLIRASTWSVWSHCGLVLPGGIEVLDSTAFHGVRRRPLQDLKTYASKLVTRLIEVPDPEAGIAFGLSQIGARYDWQGAAGLGLRGDWYSDDAWFCSDLLEEIVYKAGRQRLVNQPRRVTPQLSWMMA